MKKTSFLIAAAAAMTVAAGTAVRAEAVPEETTAPVPAISVSEDGELSFAPEFQSIVDNVRINDDEIQVAGCLSNFCPPSLDCWSNSN